MISSIRIAGFEISMLQFLLVIGTLGMLFCVCKRKEHFGLGVWQCVFLTVSLTFCGVAGAMLLYFIECGEFGGVSFYGSVFLIPLLMPLIGFLLRLKANQTMDICGPCVAIMIGCLRFGCFLTGCCGGWTVCLGRLCFEWPTQVLDSVGDFLIMLGLLQKEEHKPQSGILYPLFMVEYSAMRFCLEFLRDTPKDWLYLSHGQWFAILALIVGGLWISLQRNRTERNIKEL